MNKIKRVKNFMKKHEGKFILGGLLVVGAIGTVVGIKTISKLRELKSTADAFKDLSPEEIFLDGHGAKIHMLIDCDSIVFNQDFWDTSRAAAKQIVDDAENAITSATGLDNRFLEVGIYCTKGK